MSVVNGVERVIEAKWPYEWAVSWTEDKTGHFNFDSEDKSSLLYTGHGCFVIVMLPSNGVC